MQTTATTRDATTPVVGRFVDRQFKTRLKAFAIVGFGIPVALLVACLTVNAVYLAAMELAG